LTHTIPLLFAGADCSFVDFAGVRALVVLPELPVAGGAVGAPASAVPEASDDCRVLLVDSFVLPDDSFVRALEVLPEFAPAVGFVEFPAGEFEALPESFDALFDVLLLAVPALLSPVGGVALAEGSAAALFLVLLVAVGVVLAFSPSVFAALSLLVLDSLREEVAEPPEPLVSVSVPAAWFESAFFLVLVFFEVLEVSLELGCGDVAESVAGFFFFFVVVESLCDGSGDCVDGGEAFAGEVLTRPSPSNHADKTAVNTAKRKFFFIATLLALVIDCKLHIALVRADDAQDVLHEQVSQYRGGCSQRGY
jgi:hypothetical protein